MTTYRSGRQRLHPPSPFPAAGRALRSCKTHAMLRACNALGASSTLRVGRVVNGESR